MISDKQNVFLAIKVGKSFEESFLPVVVKLKALKTSMPRMIIFCKQRDHCAILYSYFKYHLCEDFTNPPGASIHQPMIFHESTGDLYNTSQ